MSLFGAAQRCSCTLVHQFLEIALFEVGEDLLVGNLMKALLSGFQTSGIYLPQHGHMVVQASQSVIVKGSNQQGLGIFFTHRSIHHLLFELVGKLPWWSFILLHAV